MMRRFILILMLTLAAILPAHAALRAWVDNPQVAPGETVRLTLAHDGQTDSRPDLGPLKQDFDVVGSSTSSQVQIVNGKVSSTTQLELSLSPRHGGPLTIPAITWDSDRSQPLTLNVASGSGGTNNSGANTAPNRVFVDTQVDQKSPYVQAAVHVTVRVYTAVPLSHAELDFGDSDAALVRQVGSDGVSNVEKNGMSYQVVTRQYLVFPQHSGEISIAGPTLSGSVPDRSLGLSDPFSGAFANSPFAGMLGTARPIRIHADPIVLNVQPRPTAASASYWLPARNVSLTAHWNPSSLEAHVGDPITVDLKLQADDLTAAQLPDLAALLNLPSGLKAYPDQPNLKDAAQGADVIGSRDQSIALIADQPGHFTIPELHLSWWDTKTNQPREVTLPSRTLAVQAAPGSAPASAQAQQQSSAAAQSSPPTPSGTAASSNDKQSQSAGPTPSNDSTWKWISLGFGLLWLGTLAAWLARGKRRAPPSTATPAEATHAAANVSQARTAFLEACRANDAPAARRNLLLWANAKWRGPRIQGLGALARLLEDPQIKQLLQALDGACYAQAPWDGAVLAKALPDLTFPERATPSNRRYLAPLYR